MIVANFLAGLIVGALLGLAVAPVLRAWINWRVVEESRRTRNDVDAPDPSPIDR
jgi:hypothetical protein